MSGCRSVGPWLDGFHDGELGALRRWRVGRHLGRCDACRRELADVSRLGEWLRAGVEPESTLDVWPVVAARLPASAPAAAAGGLAPVPPRWRWAAPAFGALAAASVAGVLLLDVPDAPGPEVAAAANDPSGVVRSIFAPKRPVMVFEAEQGDDPTIIWLVDEMGERTPEVTTSVGI